VLSNVARPWIPEGDCPEPTDEARCRRHGDKDEPEPEEYIDLLVEEVDRQNALDRMRVVVTHLTDPEVAKRDAREARRGGVESLADDQVPDDLDAVEVIVGAKKQIQHEQLKDAVAEVEHLRDHVKSQQVVAIAIAARQPQVASGEPFKTDAAAASVFALVVKVMVKMANHVLDGLVATFWVQRILDRLGRLDEVVDVDTRSLTEDLP